MFAILGATTGGIGTWHTLLTLLLFTFLKLLLLVRSGIRWTLVFYVHEPPCETVMDGNVDRVVSRLSFGSIEGLQYPKTKNNLNPLF